MTPRTRTAKLWGANHCGTPAVQGQSQLGGLTFLLNQKATLLSDSEDINGQEWCFRHSPNIPEDLPIMLMISIFFKANCILFW